MNHYCSKNASWKEAKERILASLDIAAEFTAMGVEIVGHRPCAKGWLSCRAVARKDRNPSAGINVKTGRYKDFSTGESLSFFDFAAKYGGIPGDWREAIRHFAQRTGVELPARSRTPSAYSFGERGDDLSDSEILSGLGIQKIERNGERGARLLIHRPECKGGPDKCHRLPTDEGIVVVWTRPRGPLEWRNVKNIFDMGYPTLLQRFGERAKKFVNDEESGEADPRKISLERVIQAIARAAGIYSDEFTQRSEQPDSLYPSDYRESAGECPILFPVNVPCRRCVMRAFKSRTEKNRDAAFHLSCNRWNCAACAPRKKQGWAKRIFRGLQELGTDAVLYAWHGKASDWPAMRQRLRGSQFCRVEHGENRTQLLIVTTAKLDGAKAMQAEEAFLCAAKAIEDIPLCRGKPISASRGWLPEEVKERHWKLLGKSSLTPVEIERNLEAEKERGEGFNFTLWGAAKHGRYVWAAGLSYPPAMEETARQDIRQRLFGLRTPRNEGQV